MSVIAELSVPTDALHLGKVLERHPRARIEVEPIIPTGEEAFPFFRVGGVDVEAAEATIESLPAVRTVTRIDEATGLFEVGWDDRDPDRLPGLLNDSDVTLLKMSTGHDGWRVELRARRHEDLRRLQERCRDAGIASEPQRVGRLSESDGGDRYALTDEQREALLLALERGYFEQPRRTSLEGLAETLGISRQAVAGRLRRGQRNLLENTLRSP